MNSAPKIVIIRGSVGAGKSSVIEVLARSISDVSSVDFDAFKRHIDSTESSEWRRKIAMNTALFLCEQLMQAKRNILVDIPSSQDDFLAAYRALAVKYGYALHSFMLHPPIEACIDRARKRVVPGISYAIDRKMIEKYCTKQSL